MLSKYVNYTKEELIEEQNNLRINTGEDIKGALGGLPVVEQTQEYFAVFDEAGSTGPEIIDKTQLRISYLVDSQLNTSKPVEGQPAALNATQNFGKQEECIVRADNATVLNQNLTGKQSIYDIGALALISTTEFGKSNDEYITTMSFNTVGGQIVGEAQNLSSQFRQSTFNELASDGELTAIFSTIGTDLSQSFSGYDWVEFNDNSIFTFKQDTTVAGTRIRFVFSGNASVQDVYFGQQVTIQNQLVVQPGSGGAEEILATGGSSFVKGGGGGSSQYTPQNYTLPINMQTPFRNFFQDDQMFVRLIRTSPSGTNSNTTIKFTSATFSSQQETPPGDVLIIGVNACTSSYWSGFETIGDSSDLNKNYSILTASQDFSSFIDGNHIQRMNSASAAFDPNNDGNTFNPIQTALTFEVGDEIRFEFNKNKVYKIIKSIGGDDGRKVFIHPAIDTVQLEILGSNGTQLNHFTHYRIIPNGGYLIINQKKDNQAGPDQDFRGIITPQFPSIDLERKGDELIYELKQAGIIET